MTKPKTLEQLRAEKERAETQLAQEKHLSLIHISGEEMRLFLTEDGYQAALQSQQRREIKIKRYARVIDVYKRQPLHRQGVCLIINLSAWDRKKHSSLVVGQSLAD